MRQQLRLRNPAVVLVQLPVSSGAFSSALRMVAARVARPGHALAIMKAAALTADATLPCRTLGDTDRAAVTRVRVRIGPLSTLWRSALANWPAAGRSPDPARSVPGSDSGSGPPRTGCQHTSAGSMRGTFPRKTAVPRAGEISRAATPRWVADAATRNSTASGGRPAANAARTSAIRCCRSSGESSRVLSGRHGRSGSGRTGACSRRSTALAWPARPHAGRPDLRRLVLGGPHSPERAANRGVSLFGKSLVIHEFVHDSLHFLDFP